jgi:hypothetical protein
MKVSGRHMNIDKAQIIASLRARGLDDRADWVDRILPDLVDTTKNESLLKMLGIDPNSPPPTAAAPDQA